jgi:hypothetical protein
VLHFDLSHDLIPVSANAAAAVGQELVLELPGQFPHAHLRTLAG